MSEFLAAINSLEVGGIVDLYEIDLTPLGIDIQYKFTPSDHKGDGIVFGGELFVALGIEITGFERSSEDQPPEPTMSIANVDKGGNALLHTHNDLIGAKVTRMRTLTQFLDMLPDGETPNPTADPEARFPDEIWYIEQKTEGNRILVQWRLKSALDLDGVEIPKRRVLKNVCERNYRQYDEDLGDFVYATVNACPYAGDAMFDRGNVPTDDPKEDVCPLSLKGCKVRFGTEPLPGWFFPGAAKIPQ